VLEVTVSWLHPDAPHMKSTATATAHPDRTCDVMTAVSSVHGDRPNAGIYLRGEKNAEL
jgi:hypothetical protein